MAVCVTEQKFLVNPPSDLSEMRQLGMGNLEVARGTWDLSSLIPSVGSHTTQADGPSPESGPGKATLAFDGALGNVPPDCFSVCPWASSVCGNYCRVCVTAWYIVCAH